MTRARWHHFWCKFWYHAHCWCGNRASLHHQLSANAVIDEVNRHRATREVS